VSHVITVEANCGCDRIYEPWLDVICSCGTKLLGDVIEPLTVQRLVEVTRKHMEETYPQRLIEEMARVPRISAKELGFTDEEIIQKFGGNP
jgi:hypothetical protein